MRYSIANAVSLDNLGELSEAIKHANPNSSQVLAGKDRSGRSPPAEPQQAVSRWNKTVLAKIRRNHFP
jgi:hypothetical protein